MDKRQSSARQVDCRMMHRSRCFRMIVGESGCPRLTDLLISRTAGLLPQMPYLADEVHFITGDKAGNLWLSEEKSLLHLLEGRLVEQIPWSELGRSQRAEVLLSGREPGGVWLGFWQGGGLLYFKDHQIRASYTAANGLGEGGVADLQLDRDGALWAATHAGVSRLKDGRITTLTSRNGLPCDTIHWTMEDDDRSFWLYTACGLVRIVRSELDAWIADPKRRIETTVWDAADGVRLRSTASSEFGPRVAKSTDGKLWFVTGEGVQIVDPRHLAVNKLPPPVHIEQIIANHKIYWQNLPGAAVADMRLPALIRDLQIDYTALSLVAPEKVRFRFKLEAQDSDWREVVNERQVQYSNLAPGTYRFRVIACNNSGVWNEEGASLDFSIAPAYYQTNWFRALCAAAFLALLWAAYRVRVRQLRRQEKKLRDVIETIPTFAWTALPDGSSGLRQSPLGGVYGYVQREDGGLRLGSRRSPRRLKAICGEVARLGGDRRALRTGGALPAGGGWAVSLVLDSRRAAAGCTRQDRQVVRYLDRH